MTVQQSSLAVTAHFTPECPPHWIATTCFALLQEASQWAHLLTPSALHAGHISASNPETFHQIITPPPCGGGMHPGGGGGFSRNRALWELKGLSSAPPIITRLSLECPLDGSVKKANKPAVSATYLLISSVSLNYSNVLNWIFHKKSNLLSTLKKKKR